MHHESPAPKTVTLTSIHQRRFTSADHYVLSLSGPIPPAKPGQFVMISPHQGKDPFLKRPYSVFRQGRREGKWVLDLLIKVVGKGSAQMASLPLGSRVDVIGPLGNPFPVDETSKRVILVGGGIGVAPLIMLSEHPSLEDAQRIALVGGRSASDLQGVPELRESGATVRLATEDGSTGSKGFITLPLQRELDALSMEERKHTVVYACGPEAMMKAVGKMVVPLGIPCWLSLEAFMGCGFGVCLGCVTQNHEGNYERVCHEGPVFAASHLKDYH